jgi:Mn2+/Fe2+ NRAMP family transporter
MNKALSIAILVAGIVLLVFGINAHDSLASNAKEALTGSPTDKSMWLIILGLIGIIVGGLNSFFGRSRG